VIQTAFREVSDALVAGTTYDEQMAAQKANLEANKDYFNHARDRYQQGVDSFSSHYWMPSVHSTAPGKPI
jgi:multidrug efflux system outer membrane protein